MPFTDCISASIMLHAAQAAHTTIINATFHQVTHETSLVFTVNTAKSKNNNIAAIIHLSAKTQKKAVMTVARGVFERNSGVL